MNYMVSFIRCKNPNVNHIKYIYGDLIDTWKGYKCDCGYEFEDNIYFENVDPMADTKELPVLKDFE